MPSPIRDARLSTMKTPNMEHIIAAVTPADETVDDERVTEQFLQYLETVHGPASLISMGRTSQVWWS